VEQEAIRSHIGSEFADIDVQVAGPADGSPEIAWGDTFFIHKDDPHDFPFATIVTKDYGDFDRASNLNRPGVFRLNIGVSKKTFDSLFTSPEGFDFTKLDLLMPHPVYGPNHWVCVLNPSNETFRSLRPLLEDAYQVAVKRAGRKRR
jgi:Family of unknown function (DUF6194)